MKLLKNIFYHYLLFIFTIISYMKVYSSNIKFCLSTYLFPIAELCQDNALTIIVIFAHIAHLFP